MYLSRADHFSPLSIGIACDIVWADYNLYEVGFAVVVYVQTKIQSDGIGAFLNVREHSDGTLLSNFDIENINYPKYNKL